uniref:Aminopeptidase N n=1 Tax=Candidatus Kentrum eta TaxID=2126337 RepID=A0A450URJ1_9GAMM|nr:MAG: aminopeptidase N [Candidatus Kentron sp. H]VFJ88904.1 MAG: aminopeptidase N [Candidatus Kentron sp. H]VFJ95147.1 MAG: aminopeptidase N [Candidatus Kentron sp. H]
MSSPIPSAPTPDTTFRKDYAPPDYLIDHVALHIDLGEEETTVTARLAIRRHPDRGQRPTEDYPPLVLDGCEPYPDSVFLDDRPLAAGAYTLDAEHLTLPISALLHDPGQCAAPFTLATTKRLRPQDNTTLEGLYKSGGNFCTQCEAEGFRKITWFLDRPDVLARYTTTLVAHKTRYPVLLSNGNLVAQGEDPENPHRHWVRWEDPFPKPSYLFALVAGDLACLRDRFTTRAGRAVRLALYVQHHNIDKCEHAMAALKKAMAWDERVFGLEYDLDDYMIVAVDDFNMGAMENKGLNIFNSKYVLARPETATDEDYAAIEEVIAHEYFHNWTGNRVTCRDWFQLSLKEGLTVFRDQEFSAHQVARAIKRIRDARLLRESQFAEDAGPMAHPVRPDSYREISNFYTVTIYNKGAEVIRMMQTLLGEEAFRRGIELYLKRHDGQAATIEDFVRAMAQAGKTDLAMFRRWYSQSGTPRVTARGQYDPDKKTYTLTLSQSCPPTPGQPEKQPFHIPIRLGLLDREGRELPLTLAGEGAHAPQAGRRTRVLSLGQAHQTFQFVQIPTPPIPSLLRGFSAPVTLDITGSPQPRAALAFLLAHDTDPFARWDAGQTLATRAMLDLIPLWRADPNAPLRLPEDLTHAFRKTLRDTRLEAALIAEILTLPTEIALGLHMDTIDPDAIHHVRRSLRGQLAGALKDGLLEAYHAHETHDPYRYDPELAGRRRLKNLCLGYLMERSDPEIHALCLEQYHHADNMTDTLAALVPLVDREDMDPQERQGILDDFQARWRHDPLVLDKWFTVQATARRPDTLERVRGLMDHEAFSLQNPNRVRALIGAFCHRNPVRFHQANGEGYRFLADRVLELDPINPQIAARLLSALSRWRGFDPHRQQTMRAEIERVLAQPGLSKDTREIAAKMAA